MFEKLLSALPFNPGVVQQMSFYAKRMRHEESIRRIGLVFIVFAFLIQFFAFASPPKSTSAASPNDLIDGGFSSAAQAASDCQSNIENYGTILSYYGITCSRVASANTITINSDDWNGNLWSMGRDPAAIAGESPVNIPGLGYPLYERYLKGWDSPGTSSTYQALNVTSPGGQTFLLLYNCGNLTSVGVPQPVQQPPNLSISKTTVPGSPEANTSVSPGQTLGYRIYFNNSGGSATNVAIDDPQPANTTFSTFSPSTANIAGFSGGATHWGFYSMPAGSTNWYVDTYYKVNNNVPNGTLICNTASIEASGISPINSNQVCVTVEVNTPPTPTPTPPPKSPTPTCEQQLSSENQSACITVTKSAKNVTENINDANGTTAHAGDVIEYTLTAKNNGSSTVNQYIFEDSLAYVLDYATLTQSNGGTLSSSNEISWPGVNITAGKTLSKQFEVTIDNPIPETPTSTSDPNYFNLKMTNIYGNTITINLPPTVVSAVQTTTTTLPNTGPGDSVIIGAVVLAIAGFFFYRSRLLAKESRIAVTEQLGEA
ncbi:MAG: DUF7927 domain-containing protein [Candidatus Saccharimonadales bacterium]